MEHPIVKNLNKCFAGYAARQFKNAEIEILDLNNYELPLFSVDAESEIGVPKIYRYCLIRMIIFQIDQNKNDFFSSIIHYH